MKNLVIIFCCLFTCAFYAQDIDRITVNGRIVVSSKDKEGVTVYNSSSNKGTLTDENGDFEIKVALNDIVEFGALQFKDFEVKITEDVIIFNNEKQKEITVIVKSGKDNLEGHVTINHSDAIQAQHSIVFPSFDYDYIHHKTLKLLCLWKSWYIS